MVGYDNRKVAQNRKGVKRDFGLPVSTLFQAQGRKGNHNILGLATIYQNLRDRANFRTWPKFKR